MPTRMLVYKLVISQFQLNCIFISLYRIMVQQFFLPVFFCYKDFPLRPFDFSRSFRFFIRFLIRRTQHANTFHVNSKNFTGTFHDVFERVVSSGFDTLVVSAKMEIWSFIWYEAIMSNPINFLYFEKLVFSILVILNF